MAFTQNNENLLVAVIRFQIITTSGVKNRNIRTPVGNNKRKLDPEEIPNSVVWFKCVFETALSRSAGQTDVQY